MSLEGEAGTSRDQNMKNNVISSLVLTATVGGGHHQLCSTDDRNEAQRGEATCLRSQSQYVFRAGIRTRGSRILEPMLILLVLFPGLLRDS